MRRTRRAPAGLRFGTGSAEVYTNLYELDAIAAVVLGGTLLLGGRGGIAGTVAGVAILAVLDTVFNVLQVDPFAKDVLRGAIIIAAVAIYARRQIDRSARRPRFTAAGAAPTPGGPHEPTAQRRRRARRRRHRHRLRAPDRHLRDRGRGQPGLLRGPP
ncbi:hypothetical protein GCM10029992_47110 [Glycomyces albus]